MGIVAYLAQLALIGVAVDAFLFGSMPVAGFQTGFISIWQVAFFADMLSKLRKAPSAFAAWWCSRRLMREI